jgi:hypothetical protein
MQSAASTSSTTSGHRHGKRIMESLFCYRKKPSQNAGLMLYLLSAQIYSRLLSTSLLCYCLPDTPLWDWRRGQAT